jgi:hypothetical protein
MPRKLDKSGKLVPMWSFATSGWWLLKGDVTNIDGMISSFRRHVDQGVFNEKLEFEYVDTYVTRDIAISLVEAIRHRKGVECNADVTGIQDAPETTRLAIALICEFFPLFFLVSTVWVFPCVFPFFFTVKKA